MINMTSDETLAADTASLYRDTIALCRCVELFEQYHTLTVQTIAVSMQTTIDDASHICELLAKLKVISLTKTAEAGSIVDNEYTVCSSRINIVECNPAVHADFTCRFSMDRTSGRVCVIAKIACAGAAVDRDTCPYWH